jgi:tetratricopeptide (TPR) repeat protein
MKKVKYIIYAIYIMVCTSCEKYLDIKTQNQQVFIKTSSDCQKLLDNYSVFNLGYPSDGEVSAGDFFVTDASFNSPPRTQEDRNIYTWLPSAVRAASTSQWQPGYFKIYNANLVLEALNNLTDQPPKETSDALRGAALFYRAFAYWQIAQLYTNPYNAQTAEQSMGIPIRSTSDINEVSSRGNLKQTYTRIIDDLNDALVNLPATSIINTRPNKLTVKAFLARVYLGLGDYEKALTNANDVLQIKSDLLDYNTISKTSNTPFARFSNTEVIFHAVMTASPLLNSPTTSSNVAKVDPQLVASYNINDLRRSIFFKNVSGAVGSFAFTGNYEPSTNGSFFVGLAIDEMFLIRAECYARTNNVSAAMNNLNTLLRTRWISSTYVDMVAVNSDDALSKILLERRKELLMRGLRGVDLKRLNPDPRFAVSLSRTILGTTYTLPPQDPRYTLLIPNDVIQNGNLTQNPR